MDQNKLSERSSKAVFEDHLKLAKAGKLEEDLSRNISEEIVLLTNYGTFKGHAGVREAADLLKQQLPEGNYEYCLKLCHENICFLQWSGDSTESYIEDGADSFLIEKGKIRIQTIYYTVIQKSTAVK